MLQATVGQPDLTGALWSRPGPQLGQRAQLRLEDPERDAPPAAKATPAFEEDPQGAMAALAESYDNLAESYKKMEARLDQGSDRLAEMEHALDVYSQSLR